MPNTKYLRGRRYEHKTIAYLKSVHPTLLWCCRSAGSKGVWDIIGVADRFVLLVQVKAYWPSLAERQAMWAEAKKIERPRDILPQCVIWERGKGTPMVYSITEDFVTYTEKGERTVGAGTA